MRSTGVVSDVNLLLEIYLSLRQYQKAIEVGTQLGIVSLIFYAL